MWNRYFPLVGEDIPVLNKEDHVYTDSSGNGYKSVSAILSLVKPKFDVEGKAMEQALKRNTSVEKVLESWDKKKNEGLSYGTLVHESIEKYFIDREIKEARYKEVVEDIFRIAYRENGINELICFDKDKKVCGTADYVVFGKESFGISDFKTNLKFNFENQFNDKFLLDPVSHLPNSEYFIYALQLSLYAYMIENLTGLKCEYLRIYWLKRMIDTSTIFKAKWVRYTVPYLKHEVKDILCIV